MFITSDNSYWYSGTDASPDAQLHMKQISALRDMLGKFAEMAAEDGIMVSRQRNDALAEFHRPDSHARSERRDLC
jgi:hypothetical protein